MPPVACAALPMISGPATEAVMSTVEPLAGVASNAPAPSTLPVKDPEARSNAPPVATFTVPVTALASAVTLAPASTVNNVAADGPVTLVLSRTSAPAVTVTPAPCAVCVRPPPSIVSSEPELRLRSEAGSAKVPVRLTV